MLYLPCHLVFCQVIREEDVSEASYSARAHSIRSAGTFGFQAGLVVQTIFGSSNFEVIQSSLCLNKVSYELDDFKFLGPFVAVGQFNNIYTTVLSVYGFPLPYSPLSLGDWVPLPLPLF